MKTIAFSKILYWLIKIGAPIVVILLPGVALYGSFSSWEPASSALEKYKPERPIMVGFAMAKRYSLRDGAMRNESYRKRTYVLLPSTIRTFKTISVRKNADRSIVVTENRFGFPFLLVTYLACMVATWFFWFRRPITKNGRQRKV